MLPFLSKGSKKKSKEADIDLILLDNGSKQNNRTERI